MAAAATGLVPILPPFADDYVQKKNCKIIKE